MDLVKWLERIMTGFGAEWVMWLMIGLSVVSVAIILERAYFFFTLRDDLNRLSRDLKAALDQSIDAAKVRMQASPSAEAAVVLAGLSIADRGPASVEEAMQGAAALQRLKLEKRLIFLATLGNNAPFIGLFGTVIGVVGAFKALDVSAKTTIAEAASQPIAPPSVMASIAEALVATAIGIFIAIPAVAANNYFQRATRSKLGNTEALTRVLLAHLKRKPVAAAAAELDAEPDGGGDEPEPPAGRKGTRDRSRGKAS
ncbi:MAG: MotA/TolQ/ExbB proton channel family protein [Myxococcales bacterium]|nr:MotA/TolQ/ExbB proton channel family protein [Myxococcales bacterium]